MRKSLVFFVLLSAIVILGCAQQAPEKPSETTPVATTPEVYHLTILTGGAAGTYYPIGGAMANIINKYVYVDGVEATAVTSGASVANARKLGSGEAELALLQNDIAYYAYHGIEMFKDNPIKNIRGIATLYPEVIQIVTLKDKGIRTIYDLKGKKVAVGAPGSGTAVDALQILEAAGINESNTHFEYLNFKEVADALKDGTIDAGFIVAGVPTSAVMELASVRDVYIVEVPDEIYEKLKEKYPFYTQYIIPAETYKGLDKDVKSVAVMAMLATREDIPKDIIYKVTKAIFEHTDELVEAHQRAKDITLETALDGMSIPLHPGAEKFYKEKGLI
ncbi:TAXI family TRAP transporter solute-binding subunit [Archaeoglobus profundus]|uniref:TRAP transporter solute receptor, TAXI family n=1 Tax=Archaeoglobus profundus (strain DSM 5631 / JCM 9629 / NBRC 100127 / Av18) TaxID=572546 RepID=D2RE21_ARCPA|nr:TAXI family TRAP transporter solute-binding subunit [Archaeoglobus profundus]ADB58365.1 TRAP transporter solute receptor, TAXI family [Archaeoglobus profundus DSM 5631]